VGLFNRTGKRSTASSQRGLVQYLHEIVDSFLVAIIIFLVIRTFAFQAFRIPTGSMENTLLPGDFLFINKFAYGARVPFTHYRLPGYSHPKRGDIIVFQFPQDKKQDYIKRCVAVAGQTVEVRNKQLYIDGVLQDEPYVIHKDTRVTSDIRDHFGPYKVPPGNIFMMGDNRDQSYDGRYWGPVDLGLVHGKAWVTYFSWDPERHLPRPMRMFRLIH
jgi:signal peptidase I